MPDASLIVAFALTSALIELTPGPNMTYLAIVSAGEGRRLGYFTVAGVALGLAIIGIAAAMGVTAIIQASPALYDTLRWAGAAYLLWLAWDGWRGSGGQARPQTGHHREMVFFRRGLITNVLNPKAAVFYVTVLPAFLLDNPRLSDSLLLTAVYVTVATIIHILIVLLAGSVKPLLTNPVQEMLLRRTLSVLLLVVAIWFALNTAR